MKANEKRGRFAKTDARLAAAPGEATKEHTFFNRPTTRIAAVSAAALLCVLAIVAYANSIRNGFVWDDHEQVVMNAGLRPGAPWLRATLRMTGQ